MVELRIDKGASAYRAGERLRPFAHVALIVLVVLWISFRAIPTGIETSLSSLAGFPFFALPAFACVLIAAWSADKPLRASVAAALAGLAAGLVLLCAHYVGEVAASQDDYAATAQAEILFWAGLAANLAAAHVLFRFGFASLKWLALLAAFWICGAYTVAMVFGGGLSRDGLFLAVFAPMAALLALVGGGLVLNDDIGHAAARPAPPLRSMGDFWREMFGVWPGFKRPRIQGAIADGLMSGAQLLQTIASLAVFFFGFGICGYYLLKWIRDGEQPWTIAPSKLVIYVLAAIAIALVLLAIAALTGFVARLLSRQSLERQVTLDPRPPILFLRSFEDDQVSLPSQGALGAILRFGAARERLDHLLVQQFSRHGPIVAIGRPGEKDLPFGAARIYVPDDIWQAKVMELARSARAVVLVADATSGVAWEIQTMLGEPALAAKTVFITPPHQSDVRQTPSIEAQFGEKNFADEGNAIAAFKTESGEAVLVTERRAVSAASYVVALQAFFRPWVIDPPAVEALSASRGVRAVLGAVLALLVLADAALWTSRTGVRIPAPGACSYWDGARVMSPDDAACPPIRRTRLLGAEAAERSGEAAMEPAP